jgi:radical SAM family uncharacterized protein
LYDKINDMLSRSLVEKANRLLKGEKGTVLKDPGGRINVCLCYPNTYHVGMSNLGFQGLYGIVNRRGDALCERVFLPDEEDMREHIRTNTPLFSLESKRPLGKFHIVAFSISFENDYPNILQMLRLAKLNPLRRKRTENNPLLIGGGVCVTSNPEPLAELFDLLFIGEAEEHIHILIDTYKDSSSKREFLEKVSAHEGFYVPEFYEVAYERDGRIKKRTVVFDAAPEVIKKATVAQLDGRLKHSIITHNTEFSDMCLVEAMRGCPWSCRFCLAGHLYRPVRHKPLEEVKKEIKSHNNVGLIGPSLTEYRFIKEVLKEGAKMSLTSLRASQRSIELLELLKNKKSLSIAPEAGSQRLREVINKKIKEDEIISTAEEAFKAGIKTLRLYFMVGLPTETEEDIEAIAEVVRKIRALSDKGIVVLSVSVFVPKPFTPFQWHPMEREEVVKRRLKYLKGALLKYKGIRLFHDVLKYSYLQGILSRGDRRLSNFLLRLEEPSKWRQTLSEEGLSEEFYLYRKRSFDETLPWDFIDTGIPKRTLWSQYMKALKGL